MANEPPSAKKLAIIRTPAVGSIQNERAFRRGNAMSGAPIISGITKFAMPANTGMMKRKIISEACTENRPLKVFGSTNCVPGWASSARITIAISPPAMKKKKVVTMYWMPITL